MTDYTKPFPCGDCGEMVMVGVIHTKKDCLRWRRKLKCVQERLSEGESK